MKVLFISREADSLDLSLRMQMEGTKVHTYVKDTTWGPDVYKGIIELSDTWSSALPKSDFAFFDSNSDLSEIKRAIWQSKKPAIGISHSRKPITICGKTVQPWDFPLATEVDRKWGHKLLEYFKIGNKMPNWEFTKIPEAVKHIKENPKAYVLKVEGSADSDLTYVGITEDGEDILKYMDTLSERPDIKGIKKIILEEKKKGIEIATSAYFNGKDFYARDINFEHKLFATGNENDNFYGLGFNTGEQGTCMRFVECHRLFTETVEKMGDFLKDIDFRGQIDINGILNDEGYWPVEFTIRVGVPAFMIEMEFERNWSEFLYAIASGEKATVKPSNDWALGVVMCGQGYPFYEDVGSKKSFMLPVLGVTEAKLKHLHFLHVLLKGDDLYTMNAYIGCATGKGKTLENAQETVYNKLLKDIKIPGLYYRTDIGKRVEVQMEELNRFGYGV